MPWSRNCRCGSRPWGRWSSTQPTRLGICGGKSGVGALQPHQRPGSQVRKPTRRSEPVLAIQSIRAQGPWRRCAAFPEAGTLCTSAASQRHAAGATTSGLRRCRFAFEGARNSSLSAVRRRGKLARTPRPSAFAGCVNSGLGLPEFTGLNRANATWSFTPTLPPEQRFPYTVSRDLSDHDDG